MTLKVLAVGAALGVALAGGGAEAVSAENIYLTHVHGLAYTGDGESLFIPSHHGLGVYRDGKWSKFNGPEHDFMGFTATEHAFYSSGHPAPGSGLVNPFGLIKSADGGKSWQKLGLEGESDFHMMAASFGTNAIYVQNSAPNSRMSHPGLYRTLNDGFSWQPLLATGLRGDLRSLAVHPVQPDVFAAGTESGLYLSRDGGRRFRAIVQDTQVVALQFDLDGKQLWYSTFDTAPGLYRVDIRGGKPTKVALPPLRNDAVSFIAQNPEKRHEYAIATFQRDVYLSSDDGRTWKQIARHGGTQ